MCLSCIFLLVCVLCALSFRVLCFPYSVCVCFPIVCVVCVFPWPFSQMSLYTLAQRVKQLIPTKINISSLFSVFVQDILVTFNPKCEQKCTETLKRYIISSDETSWWNSVSSDKSIPSSTAYCAISHLYTLQFFTPLNSSQTKSFWTNHLSAPPWLNWDQYRWITWH